MNGMEELVWELFGDESGEQGLPPGFRFHPTDEELITFYLASKVFNGGLCGVDIMEVDLNRCEPWELPETAKMGEKEWYFFSLRDRKYPTGLRTNRATGAGYWKATGKDREIRATASGVLVGMKKTLVFYKGRAPRGEKTKWVLHEYRLDGELSCRHTCKEEWVICRILHKSGAEKRNPYNPNPSSTSTSTLTQCFPPFLDFQSLEENPMFQLPLQFPTSNPPFLPLNLPLSSLPKTLQQQQQHQEQQPATVSSFLESYLQNPLLYDFGIDLIGASGPLIP